MTHRCPWCGEIIEKTSYLVLGEFKCIHCGNQYKPHLNFWNYVIFLILILPLNLFIRPIYLIPLFFIAMAINLQTMPYEKISLKYVYQVRFNAKVNFLDDVKHLHNLMRQKQIFTICFLDNNKNPISKMIAVSAEYIKWNKRSCDVTFAFLPYGLQFDCQSQTLFNIFYDNKLIANGKVTNIIKEF